jgi:signal transduction histidine kinase
MAEQRARGVGVEIEDRLPEELPAVHANGHEMEQIFLNLLLNGLDALEGAGALRVGARRATETLRGGLSTVEAWVEDTGRGIPGTDLERVFVPFFTTKREGRGTGLGLSICQGLVRSHGGEIEVRSEEGRGTRMVVRLPLAEDNDG